MKNTMPELTSFWDHVHHLQGTLFRSFIFVCLGMVCALFFYKEVISLITFPLIDSHHIIKEEIKRERISNQGNIKRTITLNNVKIYASKGVEIQEPNYEILPQGFIEVEYYIPKQQLILLGPLEGMLVTVKLCFWIGLCVSSPFWVYYLLKFIKPGLHSSEYELLIPFLMISLFFICLGIIVAYLFVIPLANAYLSAFNAQLGMNLWSLSQYLDYTLFLMIAHGVAFEMGGIILFLVHIGVLKKEFLKEKRRFAIVMAFILAALLTPPDVLTQVLLALPLIGMYELAIVYSSFKSSDTRDYALIPGKSL